MACCCGFVRGHGTSLCGALVLVPSEHWCRLQAFVQPGSPVRPLWSRAVSVLTALLLCVPFPVPAHNLRTLRLSEATGSFVGAALSQGERVPEPQGPRWLLMEPPSRAGCPGVRRKVFARSSWKQQRERSSARRSSRSAQLFVPARYHVRGCLFSPAKPGKSSFPYYLCADETNSFLTVDVRGGTC